MKLAWLGVLGAALTAIGCGGGGTSIIIDPGYDGAGTSLPTTDASVIIDHRHAYAAAALIPSEWLTLARSQMAIFGHQSVGGNIIDGLNALEGYNSRYAVTVVSFPDSNIAGCVSEFSVGANGDPQGKIDDFVAKVNSGAMPVATVATFKFCYVDFDGSTNATTVFNAYRDAMALLETGHPGIKFVYCTAPLETSFLQSRHDFNTLVRNYCATNNKTLFDIASIESYTPSDVAVGGLQPVLYSGYTSDGGHLNAAGANRVARAWWWLMARLSGWNGV